MLIDFFLAYHPWENAQHFNGPPPDISSNIHMMTKLIHVWCGTEIVAHTPHQHQADINLLRCSQNISFTWVCSHHRCWEKPTYAIFNFSCHPWSSHTCPFTWITSIHIRARTPCTHSTIHPCTLVITFALTCSPKFRYIIAAFNAVYHARCFYISLYIDLFCSLLLPLSRLDSDSWLGCIAWVHPLFSLNRYTPKSNLHFVNIEVSWCLPDVDGGCEQQFPYHITHVSA